MSEPFIGEIRMFAGNFAPRGWAFCDGQLLAVSQNDALFSLVGTIYGGDGSTSFGLPDMRGRLPIHAGTGPGLSPRQLGSKAGEEQVTLTVNELPNHSHGWPAGDGQAQNEDPTDTQFAQGSASIFQTQLGAGRTPMNSQVIGAAGGSQPHTNVMPFLCVNFIIALVGIYPSRH